MTFFRISEIGFATPAKRLGVRAHVVDPRVDRRFFLPTTTCTPAYPPNTPSLFADSYTNTSSERCLQRHWVDSVTHRIAQLWTDSGTA